MTIAIIYIFFIITTYLLYLHYIVKSFETSAFTCTTENMSPLLYDPVLGDLRLGCSSSVMETHFIHTDLKATQSLEVSQLHPLGISQMDHIS